MDNLEQEDTLASRLSKFATAGTSGSDTRALNTPEAWRPRMEADSSGGFVVSRAKPAGQLPDARAILMSFDLDPDQWIIRNVRRSQWDSANGEALEACRISIEPIVSLIEGAQDFDLEKLVAEIKKWRPAKQSKKINGELGYLFSASDQQIGKRGSGTGTAESIQRILEGTELGVQRLAELRKIGRNIGKVVIPQLGDHVEGNVSQGGRLQSPYASDLGLTEQVRVARRLLMCQIKAFAPVAEEVVIAVINGNHDEVTRQIAVDPAEGWNTEIASAVQDACQENDALAHVSFRFPEKDHQTLAINVNGMMVGIFHGHQARSGQASKYISGQAAGLTALGACDMWLSGHYHHFRCEDIGPRFWAQCPTTDPGSAWFRDRTGLESRAGFLTLVVGDGYDPRKDLSILAVNR